MLLALLVFQTLNCSVLRNSEACQYTFRDVRKRNNHANLYFDIGMREAAADPHDKDMYGISSFSVLKNKLQMADELCIERGKNAWLFQIRTLRTLFQQFLDQIFLWQYYLFTRSLRLIQGYLPTCYYLPLTYRSWYCFPGQMGYFSWW